MLGEWYLMIESRGNKDKITFSDIANIADIYILILTYIFTYILMQNNKHYNNYVDGWK